MTKGDGASSMLAKKETVQYVYFIFPSDHGKQVLIACLVWRIGSSIVVWLRMERSCTLLQSELISRVSLLLEQRSDERHRSAIQTKWWCRLGRRSEWLRKPPNLDVFQDGLTVVILGTCRIWHGFVNLGVLHLFGWWWQFIVGQLISEFLDAS